MSTDALSFCLDLGRAHASLALKLDDDLGAFHGLNFADFTLLYLLLRTEQGRMPMADLARTLGLPMSALIRKMVLLEKTGLAERVAGAGTDNSRHAALRSGGRQLVRDAAATVEAHCKEAVRSIDQRHLSDAHAVLRAI
ncbi:AsnC family transcriptional regulator [Variovorax sp.]|uniref:AsnC family transcriptional regulator n=1 Tax=Variovorax sp. TaxID=1871043 RepID=UPI003BA859A5